MNFPSFNVFARSPETSHRAVVRVPREHAAIVRAGYRGECAECKDAADAYVAAFDEARVAGHPDPALVAFNAHAGVYGRDEAFKEEMVKGALSALSVCYVGVIATGVIGTAVPVLPDHFLAAGCATSLVVGIGINVASLALHKRAFVPEYLRGVVLSTRMQGRPPEEPVYTRGVGYVPQPIRDEDLVTI